MANKKSILTPLVGVGVCAAIIFFLKKGIMPYNRNTNLANYIARLVFRIRGVGIVNAEGIIITLEIDNPNPEKINMQTISGAIYLNGVKLGAVYANNVFVQSYGAVHLELPINLNSLSLVQFISSIPALAKMENDIKFMGTVTIDNSSYVISDSYQWRI